MFNLFIYIIGIDLGTYTGISLCKYDINNNRFYIIKTKTIEIKDDNFNNFFNKQESKIIPKYIINSNIFNTIITKYIDTLIFKYIHDKNFIIKFVTEDVHISYNMIRAFKSLFTYMNKLSELVLFRYNNVLIKIPPKFIKKIFTNIGNSNKENMKIQFFNLLYKNNNISIDSNINLCNLTEHEIDAIAICYTYIYNKINIYNSLF